MALVHLTPGLVSWVPGPSPKVPALWRPPFLPRVSQCLAEPGAGWRSIKHLWVCLALGGGDPAGLSPGEASCNHDPCPRRPAKEGWEVCGLHSYLSYLLANGLPTLANHTRRGEVGGRVQSCPRSCLNLDCLAFFCFINTGVGESPPARKGGLETTAVAHREPWRV